MWADQFFRYKHTVFTHKHPPCRNAGANDVFELPRTLLKGRAGVEETGGCGVPSAAAVHPPATWKRGQKSCAPGAGGKVKYGGHWWPELAGPGVNGMCRRRDGSLGNGVLRVWRVAMGRWCNRSPAGAATAAETGVTTGHRYAREGAPAHP